MTTQLKLYNRALHLCGETALSSTSEERESRRLLDAVWDDNGVDYCLTAGQWNFATRTIQIDYDSGITIEFGYRYAFAKPSDYLSLIALSADEYFNTPLNQYNDEQDYWYADEQILYVKYVSNGASYGGDLTAWPAWFTDYVAAYFASKIVKKLTSDEGLRQSVKDELRRAEFEAKNRDMQNSPARFLPQGSWTSSRQGRSRRDRGNRGSLIG